MLNTNTETLTQVTCSTSSWISKGMNTEVATAATYSPHLFIDHSPIPCANSRTL